MSRAPESTAATTAIAIGASAGGVEAILTLLAALREDFPAPVFVVLHLPRDRPSLLRGIFQDACACRVVEAVDKQQVEPGVIYIAPPDYHLLIDEGPSLALSVDDAVNYSRPSIDVLFESCADAYGERMTGVVLSGANGDGAAGLRAIGANGGRMVVQDPSTAEARAMPLAAIQLNPSARVLSLPEIARLLAATGSTHG